MPRPPKRRFVEFIPEVRFFKPAGVPLRQLLEVKLGVDELEALRLKDLEGLSQEECAERMNLGQSTLQRILTEARQKLTRAIVEGRGIRIEGGNYEVVSRTYQCPDCGYRWERDPGGKQETPEDCPSCGTGELTPRWPRGRRRGRHGRGGS
jgi:predicted DNA-binding protein (UPF0251 family)